VASQLGDRWLSRGWVQTHGMGGSAGALVAKLGEGWLTRGMGG
jgi:hypothetical protein